MSEYQSAIEMSTKIDAHKLVFNSVGNSTQMPEEVKMDTVKAIKENPNCVESITVKVRGRDNINVNKPKKINGMKQNPQTNSC